MKVGKGLRLGRCCMVSELLKVISAALHAQQDSSSNWWVAGGGRRELVGRRVSEESLMDRRGSAAGWPDWWCSGAGKEARSDLGTRPMHNISKRCARLSSAGRRGPRLSPSVRAVGAGGRVCTKLVDLGWTRKYGAMEAGERCVLRSEFDEKWASTPPPPREISYLRR